MNRRIFPAITSSTLFLSRYLGPGKLSVFGIFAGILLHAPLAAAQDAEQWYADGEEFIMQASRKNWDNSPGAAKNIILFVGDGMGVSTVTAARIYAGQQLGLDGEEYSLSFEKFPWTGLSKTYNTNQQTPDSAGTMTAMMTGVKTKTGFIGIDSQSRLGDCESYINSDSPNLITALELAEIAGKSTGIVSTARLTHATPAATYAKAASRNWESSSNLNEQARALGCQDIARQLIEFEENLERVANNGQDHPNINGIDVALGGGRAQFYGQDPASLDGFTEAPGEGQRDDERNLISEWVARGGRYIMDQSGLENIDTRDPAPVLGLFESSHMRYEADRHNDPAGEPSLAEMTQTAIELLQNDADGFFLMVEGGRIDHAHHVNNAYNALNETREFARAVEAAQLATDPNETLIIVTADHSHVFTIAGYPTRGNPILGKVVGNNRWGEPDSGYALDMNDLPYTTVGYMNGLGYADGGDITDGGYPEDYTPAPGRQDISSSDSEAPGYHQESLVPIGAETHGGEDVAIYANGPGGHLLTGTLEQNLIFHVMNYAGDLSNQAEQALESP